MKESESTARSSSRKLWSETRNGRIAAAVGVIGLFVLVFWLATKSRDMFGAPALLVLEEHTSEEDGKHFTVNGNSVNLGVVWEGEIIKKHLRVKNRSDTSVRIVNIQKTCSCTAVEPIPALIPAHSDREIEVTIHVPHFMPVGSNRRPFEVRLVPGLDTRIITPTVWVLSGEARACLTCSPQSLLFELPLVKGSTHRSKVIRVQTHVPVSRLHVQCDPANAEVLVKKGAENGVFHVEVCPVMSLPPGPFNFNVRLLPISDQGHLPASDLTVQGTILGEVRVFPAIVSFGAKPVGETCVEVITLQSISQEGFSVLGSKSPADILLSPLGTDNSSRSARFKLQQRISFHGYAHSEVAFQLRLGVDEMVFRVPVSYWGIAP